MVFYGQPDHPSGAVTLASDETGAATALQITLPAAPAYVAEMLLTAQLPAGHNQTRSGRLEIHDTDTGKPVGQLDLPAAGPTGLLQLGALHRDGQNWAFQAQPEPLNLDLIKLATAAGVDIA